MAIKLLFNFQTLDGKPFYFFQRMASLKSASTIDAWYNGLIIPLGFDEIPHYGCGDASELNPRGWADRWSFLPAAAKTGILFRSAWCSALVYIKTVQPRCCIGFSQVGITANLFQRRV